MGIVALVHRWEWLYGEIERVDDGTTIAEEMHRIEETLAITPGISNQEFYLKLLVASKSDDIDQTSLGGALVFSVLKDLKPVTE